MNPLAWKVLSGLLLACVLVQQFERWGYLRIHPLFGPDYSSTPLSSSSLSVSNIPDWTYNWTRDGNNYGFNTEQCNSSFPELYREIDRSIDFWKDRVIDEETIELFGGNEGGLRVLIVDQQLRVIQTKGLYRGDFRKRIIAVLQQLSRAIDAAGWANEPFPNMEFTIVVDDIAALPKEPRALWAFTRSSVNKAHDSLFLIPDQHFYASPPEAEGFQTMQTKARKHDSRIQDKIERLVWRGVEWTNKDIRKPLLKATEGKPWADVVAINWKEKKSLLSMDEYCKYRFAVNTEGRAWSARMTHLLNCDNLVMVHDFKWIAHYYHLIETETDTPNCVRVERNFSDLEAKVQYYNEHTAEAQEIASRAKEIFRERYTTPAATACYWRSLLRAWGTIAFKPVIMEKMKGGKEKLRGVSIEEFTLHINNVDFPYEKEKH